MRGHFLYLHFKTFSMTPRTPQCEVFWALRCFGPCYRALNIRKSRRTPNPHFFQVLGFTPTLGQSRVVTCAILVHERGERCATRTEHRQRRGGLLRHRSQLPQTVVVGLCDGNQDASLRLAVHSQMKMVASTIVKFHTMFSKVDNMALV
jgi:hypothetical protein